MSSYIGKIQIESGEQILIGSTLYGTCSTAAATVAKEVTLSGFDTLMKGITVHVRFINGNSVTSGLTLKVGSSNPQNIIGNCVCNPNDVVAFTYWEETVDETLVKTWYVNNNIVVAEGNTDGTILVNGQAATVHGLGSAAYTNSSAYATSAQGTLADNAMPKSGGTFTGAVILPGIPTTNNEAATKQYVDSKVEGLDGLTSAMHFKGAVEAVPPSSGTYDAGDVVLAPNHKEYVYDGTNWIELGDEGSYILKTSQTTDLIGSASGWSAGSTPTLGDPISADDITGWDAGSASSAVIENGVLRITNSTIPTLGYTSRSIPNVTGVGSTPQLTVTPTDVVVPVITTP